jgi:hypothetical protein
MIQTMLEHQRLGGIVLSEDVFLFQYIHHFQRFVLFGPRRATIAEMIL